MTTKNGEEQLETYATEAHSGHPYATDMGKSRAHEMGWENALPKFIQACARRVEDTEATTTQSRPRL